jgi:hypothetical protein
VPGALMKIIQQRVFVEGCSIIIAVNRYRKPFLDQQTNMRAGVAYIINNHGVTPSTTTNLLTKDGEI